MKSYMAKAEEVVRKWYVIDATDLVLGRLASKVANILRGKNKPTFTPNVDTGDFVIVVNCDKVRLTGKKLEQKYHYYHTGYAGGLKSIQYKHLMQNDPAKAVTLAVKGMLPKNILGRHQLKRLRVFAGALHNHEAQKPEELKI
ncbi:MAG: 50S ribosomal protein L13 [Clostridia bacterium]|nr:50S ribosomal protein L13 [Clostridia bacterium]